MKKVDKTVKQETLYIGIWTVILSVMMQSVFLIIGKWDYTVLLGNILSGALAIANFFFIGITVQIAIAKNDEKEAKKVIRLSQSLRMLLIFVIVVLGVVLPVFNMWTSIIPLLFPRIAIIFRMFFNKK